MSLQEQFEIVQADVKKLTKRPDNQELLDLYSLYKQGTSGDVTGKRPGMLDVKGRAKYDAWAGKKGMAKEQAMQQYIDYVAKLQEKY